MNWLRNLLGIKPKEAQEPTFKVIYYPLSCKYYVKYKGRYFNNNPYTGLIDLEEEMRWASSVCTEEQVERWIAKFKEQRFGVNVIVTNRT